MWVNYREHAKNVQIGQETGQNRHLNSYHTGI